MNSDIARTYPVVSPPQPRVNHPAQTHPGQVIPRYKETLRSSVLCGPIVGRACDRGFKSWVKKGSVRKAFIHLVWAFGSL